MRIISNQSEKRFVSRLMKNGKKSIRQSDLMRGNYQNESNPIRKQVFNPISVSEPMRIIPNQSEKRFVSHLMKNGQKSIRPNLINSETSIRNLVCNPN